jgi:hypothetical protein
VNPTGQPRSRRQNHVTWQDVMRAQAAIDEAINGLGAEDRRYALIRLIQEEVAEQGDDPAVDRIESIAYGQIRLFAGLLAKAIITLEPQMAGDYSYRCLMEDLADDEEQPV